jgi:uncharacterized SAM-binding protein YcdF (DUF218 family)
MARWLEERSVPAENLGLELCSLTTAENAAYCRRQWPDARRVVLVTSCFHLPRALDCFERAGFECRPHPAPDGALPLRIRWLESVRGLPRVVHARLGRRVWSHTPRRSHAAGD